MVNTAGAEERFPWALAPLRAVAMLSGGLSGWAINALFGLNLIRLVVPRVGPAAWRPAR